MVQDRKEGIVIRFRILAFIFVLLLPQIVSAQTREKIRVALGSISVNSSVIPIGAQHGLYTKYGVDLEPIYFGGGMNSIAALTSNSVQLLAAGSTATIGARVGGIDITMLTVQSNKLDYSVLVAPDVKTPQDLKGKIVTGTRTGASADTALRLYLQRHGLVPDKDVIFISVADSQQGRFNALVRGVVAGTVLPPPYSTVAKQQGFRELADLRQTDIEYSGTSHRRHRLVYQGSLRRAGRFLKGIPRVVAFLPDAKRKVYRRYHEIHAHQRSRARRRGLRLLRRYDAGDALCQRGRC